jgi:hypothetical protein
MCDSRFKSSNGTIPVDGDTINANSRLGIYNILEQLIVKTFPRKGGTTPEHIRSYNIIIYGNRAPSDPHSLWEFPHTKCVFCSEAILDCTVNAHCAWNHGATFIENTQIRTSRINTVWR